MSLTMQTSTLGSATVLAVAGDIDVQSSSQLKTAFDQLFADEPARKVVLDLAGTDFLDSSALGVVVGAHKQLESNRSSLTVVCDKPHLLRVFEITRLRDVIDIVPTLAAAVS